MDAIVEEFRLYWQYKFIGKLGNRYYFETLDKHVVTFNINYINDFMVKVKRPGIVKERKKISMEELKECKICGYKKPRNGNRIIKPVSFNITTLEERIMIVIYSKWDIPMCNICLDSLVSINKEFMEELV